MVAMDVAVNSGKFNKPVIVVQKPTPPPTSPMSTPDRASTSPRCLCALLIVILLLGVSLLALLATRNICAARHHPSSPAGQSEQPTYLVSWTYIQNYISISYFFQEPEPDVPREKSFLLVTHERVNWFGAVAACQRYNMSLASILSPEEQDQLVAQIRLADLGPVDFWTSGSGLAGGDEWLWMSGGQPFDYTNWIRFHNIILNEGYNCLNMDFYSGYAWERSPCISYKYYICQY